MKRALAAVLTLAACGTQSETSPRGDYLGLAVPGDQPVLFAPRVVSTRLMERDVTFSRDGMDVYYTVSLGRRSAIAVVRCGDAPAPRIASFSGRWTDGEPHVAPDGRLWFVSNRPAGDGGRKDFDIWFVEPTANGWSTPRNAGTPLNTAGNEYYPTVTDSGALYFTARYESGAGGDDLYRAAREGGGFAKPVNVGPPINTPDDEYNAFVAPDESWIVFGRSGRLWISHREKGAWSEPRDLTAELGNRGVGAMSPSLSPDGRFLFFTSSAKPEEEYGTGPEVGEGVLAGAREEPRIFGYQDIYWVSAEVLGAR